MKNFIISAILILATSFTLKAQTGFTALFVNDNSVFAYNTDTIISALNTSGLDYTIFDAVDSLRSPSQTEMSSYDLVIWYCSTNGVGNYLWNGTDSDNAELMAYLEGGGYLWVMGNDFLYDRYGLPYTFGPGEFVYDYLGTLEYDAQSFGDDGGLGVSQLELVAPGFSSLEIIQWIFTTAWWIDACTPLDDASAVYVMGPAGYPLEGYASAISYASEGHLAMSFFFDPALIDTYDHRVQLFKDVLQYFELFAGKNELPLARRSVSLSPNPASLTTTLRLPEPADQGDFHIQVSDITGNIRTCPFTRKDPNTLLLDISGLKPGMYLVSVQTGKGKWTEKLLVKS